MSKEKVHVKDQQDSLKFLGTPRGQYIVGQALAIAVKQLETVEGALQEKSNIADMKFLGTNLFKAGYVTHSMLSDELLGKIKEKLGNDPDKLIQDEDLVKEINDEVNALQDDDKTKS